MARDPRTSDPDPTGPFPPPGAHTPVDIHKAGQLAARMWRLGDVVVFHYVDQYVRADRYGPRRSVAWTLPVADGPVETPRLQVPAFFAGLLPEGETRRRDLQRAFHLAEDDELGLLAIVGGDTIGDVQVVPMGEPLPPDRDAASPAEWSSVSFRELWAQLPGPRSWSSIPGVQPKMSAHSRSLPGGHLGPVILKLSIPGWHGVLDNEAFFMRHAVAAGLAAADTRVVEDRDGDRALEVTRFDRSLASGQAVRHAQEDASQVLGLRPGRKYDPDARTVIDALASRCASPRMAARDLFHQLVYSYAIGNNDLHAKNLSIRQGEEGLWAVTPVYDVLHTWPYEGDHRFVPTVRPDGRREAVTRRWWHALARDIELPDRVATRILDQVTAVVPELARAATTELPLPDRARRDLGRVLRRRAQDLRGG